MEFNKLTALKVAFLIVNLIYVIVAIAALYFIRSFNAGVVLFALYLIVIIVAAIWGVVFRTTMAYVTYFYINLAALNFLVFGTLLFYYFWDHVAMTVLMTHWRAKLSGDAQEMNAIEKEFNCCALYGHMDYKTLALSVPRSCYCKKLIANPYKRRLALRKYHEHLKDGAFKGVRIFNEVPCPGCIIKYQSFFHDAFVHYLLAFFWSLFVLLVLLIAMVVVLIVIRMRLRESKIERLIEDIRKAELKSKGQN